MGCVPTTGPLREIPDLDLFLAGGGTATVWDVAGPAGEQRRVDYCRSGSGDGAISDVL